MTVNVVLLVAVPPGVVTLIVPLVVPVGTVAVIDVAETTLKLLASIPLNLTAVIPEKLVPVIVTITPAGPLVGVKPVIVGCGIGAIIRLSLKRPAAAVAPLGLLTWIGACRSVVVLSPN